MKPGPQPRIDAEEAARLRLAGHSLGVIANTYGVSRQAVHQILARREETTSQRAERLRVMRDYRRGVYSRKTTQVQKCSICGGKNHNRRTCPRG